VNVILVSYLLGRICQDRLTGLLGAVFWGLNYKHVEAVFRPHATADSLALLFSLGAFLLFLKRRPIWATLVFTCA
jgi:hypothetical protein